MIHVFADPAVASQAAADFFVQAARQAVAERGRFTVALTGGTSPKQLHTLLTQPPYRDQVDWQHLFVFWGDERCVPPDDNRYNAKMGFETLLEHVPVPQDQIFPMSGVLPPEESARQYEAQLRSHFGTEPPRFDLILLGMGDDGHTASLFPGTPVLGEKTRWVQSLFLPSQDMYRVTLTAPLINQARQIAFLVFGANKAKVLAEVLGGTDRNKYPVQLIQPENGEVRWFLDEAAAAGLPEGGSGNSSLNA